MILTVRCPAAACRKYMMVEEAFRGRKVPCLLCRTPITIPTGVSKASDAVPTLKPRVLPTTTATQVDDDLLGLN